MFNKKAGENGTRSALVTGASRGIGAAVARKLAADGFEVWLNYRANHRAAEEVKYSIERDGGRALLLPFDVADEAAVDAALGKMLAENTPFVLVNNAGLTHDTMLGLMSLDQWSEVLNANLTGFFLVTRRLLPHMQRKRAGRIINISSVSAQAGQGGQVNYAASKAGLIGATKALAREVGRRNIQVNAVAPGFIETDMTLGLPLEEIVKHIPLGRAGKPEDVAEAVSFLASPGAAYITGQVISVNGGLYAA